ncbi:MAG: DNRLRE domain-containing protein, partial [Clostridia bacterium]|nr:DNRLRE domain-containing protein [Clostridia bacterium]
MKRIISLLLTFFIIFSASLPLYVLAEEDMSDIQFMPTNGPSGEISYTEPLTVSFSDVVDSSTVNAETVKLYKDGFDVGLESSDIKVSGEVVTINTPKSPYSTYILEVRSAISSENGNSFDEDVLYTFETCVNENEINLSSSKFLSAVYLPTNPDHTGDRKSSSGGSGWLPYLYAGGTYRHYYCIIDISSLSGKNISEVIYKAFMNGSVNASLYEIDGDFTPGTTPYSELPEIGDVFATVTEAGGNGKYVDIDITSQVKKLLSEGKTELKFMLRQNVGNQSSIANESSQWSDGSWGPSVVAKYADASFSGVISTTPAAYEHLFATDGELSASLSTKPESVDASNVTLINENTGENVALSD